MRFSAGYALSTPVILLSTQMPHRGTNLKNKTTNTIQSREAPASWTQLIVGRLFDREIALYWYMSLCLR